MNSLKSAATLKTNKNGVTHVSHFCEFYGFGYDLAGSGN